MMIAIINPFRYRCYYYDRETNLYYLNSRYYNSEWGRFINAGGEFGRNLNIMSYNLFLYTNNNYISFADNDGNFAISLGIFSIIKCAAYVIAAVIVAKSLVETAIPAINNVITVAKEKRTISKSKEKTKVYVESRIISKKSKNQSVTKPCTKAKIVKNNVIRGERLTTDKSVSEVLKSKSIMCDAEFYALDVAIRVSEVTKTRYYKDSKHHVGNNYYEHYHVEQIIGHPHIWFYTNY